MYIISLQHVFLKLFNIEFKLLDKMLKLIIENMATLILKCLTATSPARRPRAGRQRGAGRWHGGAHMWPTDLTVARSWQLRRRDDGG